MTTNTKLYTLNYSEAQTYLWAAAFIAANTLLPQLFHLIPHPRWRLQIRLEDWTSGCIGIACGEQPDLGRSCLGSDSRDGIEACLPCAGSWYDSSVFQEGHHSIAHWRGAGGRTFGWHR